ncbi:hypothetical protein JCM8202_005993 [Rhodotorula sphaerocarpa]
MADTDPTTTLASLAASLEALDAALAPVLGTPLQEHLDRNSDDPLAQARLQVLASYLIHDLVWVYLKTAGVDPAGHPVMQEIERLKGYFAKLKAAQNGTVPAAAATTPSRPRMQLDKAAANRFITAAINRASSAARPAGSEATSAEEDDAEAGPSGTHTRFTEEEKKDLDRLLEPKDDDDDDEKERAGSDAEDEDSDGVVEEMLRGPGGAGGKKRSPKGKEAAEGGATQGKTAKRKAIDPFAGYDQPKPVPSASATSAADAPLSKKKRKRLATAAAAAELNESTAAAPESEAATTTAPTTASGGAAADPAAAEAKSVTKNQKKKKLRMKEAKGTAAGGAGARK